MAKRRWLKRILNPLLPNYSYITDGSLVVYYCLKDLKGPSFYIAFGGKEAIYHYEKEHKDSIKQFIGDHKVFIDVGANIGLFSLEFANMYPGLEVHAFEPEPINFSCLELSVKASNLKNIKLNKLGLSDKKESVNLHIDPINMGGASVVSSLKRVDSTLIELTTLDEYCELEKLTRLDVIKIDVEGFESKVLDGGKKTIKKYKPKIFLECIHDDIVENNPIASIYDLGMKFSIQQIRTQKEILPENFVDFVKEELSQGRRGEDYLISFQ